MTELRIDMGAAGGSGQVRRVHVNDPGAPPATVVLPSVFVAVRDERGYILLVCRGDSGAWELPGGRVDVGESAVGAALRETVEEAGVTARITGLVGVFTDPAHVVVSPDGVCRQQFVVCFHGWALSGEPGPDLDETIDAAWFDPVDVEALRLEPGAGLLIRHALSGEIDPHLG